VKHLLDIPKTLKTAVVFDQSVFVEDCGEERDQRGRHWPVPHRADDTSLSRQSPRDDFGITLHPHFLPRRLIALNLGASTINTMVLGGIALALSR